MDGWPLLYALVKEAGHGIPGTKRQIGSAIRPKNSRLVVPPGFILRDTADSSGPDQWILHNLSSYESPESPLSLWV